jgi:hypothetical protein
VLKAPTIATGTIQVSEEGWHDEERAEEEAEEGYAKELLSPVVDADENDLEGIQTRCRGGRR